MNIQGFALAALAVAVGLLIASKLGWIKVASQLERIRAFFVQRAGPLPVWVWAAVVLAGVLAYMYVRKIGPFAQAATDSTSTSGALYNPVSGNGSGFPAYSTPASDLSGTVMGADAGQLAAIQKVNTDQTAGLVQLNKQVARINQTLYKGH